MSCYIAKSKKASLLDRQRFAAWVCGKPGRCTEDITGGGSASSDLVSPASAGAPSQPMSKKQRVCAPPPADRPPSSSDPLSTETSESPSEGSVPTPKLPQRSMHELVCATGQPGYNPAELTASQWETAVSRLPPLSAKSYHKSLQQDLERAIKAADKAEGGSDHSTFFTLALQVHHLTCQIYRRVAHPKLVESLRRLARAANRVSALASNATEDAEGPAAITESDCTPSSDELRQQADTMEVTLQREREGASRPAAANDLFSIIACDPGISDVVFFTRITASRTAWRDLWAAVKKAENENQIRQALSHWLKVSTALMKSVPKDSGVLGESLDGKSSEPVFDEGVTVYPLSQPGWRSSRPIHG